MRMHHAAPASLLEHTPVRKNYWSVMRFSNIAGFAREVYTVFERLARNLPDPNAVKAASLANLETVSLNPDAGAGGGCGC